MGQKLTALISLIGCVAAIAAVLVVPLFVPPPRYFAFNLDTNLTILSKWMLLEVLGAVAFVVGGLCLLTPLAARYRAVAIPAMALVGWLGWSAASVAVNPGSLHSMTLWQPILFAGLAALAGPMIFTTPRRCAALLVVAAATAVVVATIGVVSSLGYGGFTRFFYGFDVSMLQEGRWRAQGGTSSSAAMSTLANPEYAGTYTAIMICLWSVVLLDWAPALLRRGSARAAMALRVACLLVLPLLLLQVVFSSSRQALITVGLAALLRLFLRLGVPARLMAAWFCGYVVALVLVGIKLGFLVLLLFAIHGLVVAWRSGALAEALRTGDRFNRWLIVGLPTVMLTAAVLFSVPGPWNPNGVRVIGRFASLLSSQDDSYKERLLMYTLASNMASNSPLFGVGPGRYRSHFFTSMADMATTDETGTMFLARQRLGNRIAEQSHNDYLQIAAETGLVGLALFLTAIFGVLYGLLGIYRAEDETPVRRLLAITFLITIAAFLCVMQSSFPLHSPSRAAVFWMIIGGAMGLVAQRGE